MDMCELICTLCVQEPPESRRRHQITQGMGVSHHVDAGFPVLYESSKYI